VRALPTLLGVLLLLAGLIAFSRSQQPSAAPPEQVTLEPLPLHPFRAMLFGQLGGEVQSRELELRACRHPFRAPRCDAAGAAELAARGAPLAPLNWAHRTSSGWARGAPRSTSRCGVRRA
jgi:hypothetical protein